MSRDEPAMSLDQIEFNLHNSLNHITKELRKDQYSIKNRLQSILYDYKFISSLNLSEYPLIPNERCGLWYLPPEKYQKTAYFKSTDGHTNEWKFSYRRLNLHLVPLIEKHNGIVVIDSTRKGKLIPDALLKTIPIWCAVLNCLVFGLESDKDRFVRLPSFVPETEKNEIVKRIPEFVHEVKRLNLVDISLTKPIIPCWIYPKNRLVRQSSKFHHIICLSASDNELQNMTSSVGDSFISWKYIQGSADDHELWITKDICNGNLTPQMFWSNLSSLAHDGVITMSEQELVQKLNQISVETSDTQYYQVRSTSVWFGKISKDSEFVAPDSIKNVVVLSKHKVTSVPKHIRHFHYELEANKKGSRALRDILPELIPQLSTETLVLCDNAKDLSIAVVLILLCQNFDLKLQKLSEKARGNKDLVKQFLSIIGETAPVNPSRNTLQSVNTFLSL